MRRVTLIVISFLIGCDRPNDATPPALATVPTTASTTRPALKPIELHYGIYLARLDLRIIISPEGMLRSVRTENKSYGPGDIDKKSERVEVREGPLTSEQIAELTRLFADWDLLSSQPYGGAADGGDVSIRYGEKTVSGGSGIPTQVADVRSRLTELAQSTPVVPSPE